MNYWRIGSNWGGEEDLAPLFKEHDLVFAGSDVQHQIAEVAPGDLIAVTNGQTIIAVGVADQLKHLTDFDQDIFGDYGDIMSIPLTTFYFAADLRLDFGFYGGQGRQFHQARDPYYINLIKEAFHKAKNQIMVQESMELLLANKNLILNGPPGTGKTYLAREIAKRVILTNDITEDVDASTFDPFKTRHLDADQIEFVDKAWQFWRDRISSADFSLNDYTNTLSNVKNEIVKSYGGYLTNYLERTSSGVYGSAKPGNSWRYSVKMNNDCKTYSLGDKTQATAEEAVAYFNANIKEWLQRFTASSLDGKIEMLENNSSPIEASQILKKIITLEHPTDMLAVYQDEALSNAYQYFIRGNDNSSSIRKNRTLLQALYQKFNLEKTKENQLRISDYIWLYFNRKSQQNIDEIKKEMLDTYFEQYFSFVQFHPSFDYTDFFDGLRPVRSDGSELGFELKNGLFKQFCLKAKKEPEGSPRRYVFVIDEINRAEISKVFGELFFSIDPGYRGKKGTISTQYSNIQTESTYFSDLQNDRFYVPENVYIIGTMNDIDRSVESFDFAMRRRFCWQEISATDRVGMWDGQIDSWRAEALAKMTAVNNSISQTDGLGPAYHLGPAYFLKLTEYKGDFKKLWRLNIGPLVKEYLRGMNDAELILKEMEEVYFNAKEV